MIKGARKRTPAGDNRGVGDYFSRRHPWRAAGLFGLSAALALTVVSLIAGRSSWDVIALGVGIAAVALGVFTWLAARR
jgi:hypothetical protein